MSLKVLKHFFEKGVFAATLVVLVLSLSGSKACQEDYFFAAQTKIATVTATAAETATPTPTGSKSPTPTGSPSVVASGSPSVNPTSTEASEDETPAPDDEDADIETQAGLLELLGRIKETPEPTAVHPTIAASQPGLAGGQERLTNWFGRAFGAQDASELSLDSDGDGYTDALERRFESDWRDAGATPPAPASRLRARLAGVDSDMDGVTDQEEGKIGTSRRSVDTDGDGCSDGAEVLSGSDPLDAGERPAPDADGDCLSDAYEQAIGANPRSVDTDGDGAKDDVEAAIGANLREMDSDNDGVLDGKEISLGADPLKPDY